ncbi:SMC-Scp complex subunit ScpB [Opitutus sp. ER46]|uniref:SMC-Scp complex subunit ScpB n=1 Tax=Opitutus sp. ER46 TaxID=2161864 RepID=UPI000D3124CD|nr:SMC-Scp complex subunit ScpB [Opitutus sp. ER46]PTX94559.1 SMC-Scp complex subunit ScpB [Opitutus sp. ER46]
MAFNLKKVLKALLLSTNQPLGIKDIQAAFTRYHDQAASLPEAEGEEAPAAAPDVAPAATEAVAAESEASVVSEPVANGEVSAESPAEPVASAEVATASAPAAEPAEILVEETPQDPELYSEVPSLVTAAQIREAMDVIAAELKAADEGILLIEGNNGYRIVTNPRFARWVRILRQEPPPVKLSQSAIETLAVIAYRQPVTRGEIETIRGVSAEAGVNKLLERELIYVVGRADAPGRPIQYGTTDQFLEFVGIKSLEELPASDVLSSRQIDEWLKTNENARPPNDTDMGLPEEQLPLDAAAADGDAAVEEAIDASSSAESPVSEASEAAEAAPPTEEPAEKDQSSPPPS